ncbi:MAG: hypothetical protein Ct9H300mP8_03030 [Gammaproteobacteria bacterium]|nr:MAG: hypothetical protein Ct9H300mP8_03030 [Gammaproteobacteria bacterium]
MSLLTTELPEDPSPDGFGFSYEEDTSLQADGRTRVLGYTRALGSGEVAYIALGHCHSPTTNSQPMVDESVERDGASPPVFRGVWEQRVTNNCSVMLSRGAWVKKSPQPLGRPVRDRITPRGST